MPQTTPFPYIALGDGFTRDWSTGTERGYEAFLDLRIWSRKRGKAEVNEIVASVDRVLQSLELMDTYRLVDLFLTATEVRRSRNGEFHEGVMHYRARIEFPGSATAGVGIS